MHSLSTHTCIHLQLLKPIIHIYKQQSLVDAQSWLNFPWYINPSFFVVRFCIIQVIMLSVKLDFFSCFNNDVMMPGYIQLILRLMVNFGLSFYAFLLLWGRRTWTTSLLSICSLKKLVEVQKMISTGMGRRFETVLYLSLLLTRKDSYQMYGDTFPFITLSIITQFWIQHS